MRLRGALPLALLALACEDPAPPPASLGTVRVQPGSGPPVAAASTAPKPVAPGGAGQPAPVRTCRATSVVGTVTRQGGAPLIKHGPLDDAPWLELGEDARVAVKHARTAREVGLRGPGVVMPCYRGGEAFLVSRGTFVATSGVGARPGAEVVVATPRGVLRYGDASLELVVSDDSVRVSVRSGLATFEAPGEGATETLRPGPGFERQGPVPSVKALIDTCARAAEEAGAEAVRLTNEGARGKTLGERAARHFRLRRVARKACGIAAAATGALEADDARKRVWDTLDAAERRWRGLTPRQKTVQ